MWSGRCSCSSHMCLSLWTNSSQQCGCDSRLLKIILCELVQSTTPIPKELGWNACMPACLHACMNEWMHEWMNERTNKLNNQPISHSSSWISSSPVRQSETSPSWSSHPGDAGLSGQCQTLSPVFPRSLPPSPLVEWITPVIFFLGIYLAVRLGAPAGQGPCHTHLYVLP